MKLGKKGEDFLEIDQSETRIGCGGHVCQWNWNEMSNLYRGPSIDASYQVSRPNDLKLGKEASMGSPL
jgi:hypothetical protein